MPPAAASYRAHRSEIGSQVDDVRDQQQCYDRPEKPWWITPSQIVRNATPGHTSDLGSHLLDHDHQGKREHKGPGQRIAELRTDLTVGGDTACIVVRGPGDQAGTKRSPQTL
jgi:hypothetical protein